MFRKLLSLDLIRGEFNFLEVDLNKSRYVEEDKLFHLWYFGCHSSIVLPFEDFLSLAEGKMVELHKDEVIIMFVKE